MVQVEGNTVLVQISTGRQRQSLLDRLKRGPLADKFFLLGLIAGIYGITYLGVHLLLIRAGQMTPWQSYPTQRYLHAVIQIFLFFGSFIIGFLLQALPRLLGRPGNISPWNLILLVPLCLGAILAPFSSTSLAGSLLLSLTFFAVLVNVLRLVGGAALEVWLSKGALLVIALLFWCVAPFVDLGNPLNSLLVQWIAVLGIVFSSSQHFIAIVLGGREQTGLFGALTLLCFVCAALGLMAFSWGGFEPGWNIFSYAALLTLLF